jgi:hypothetical protein
MTSRVAAIAVLLLGLAGPVSAQAVPADQQSAPSASGAGAPPAQTPPVDVSRLPVSIGRLQRQLQRSAIRDESVGLNLRYVVDVFGQAPPIVFLPPDSNLEFGPVPYTHADFLRHITPQEYRAPAANFNDVFRWLADKARR